MSNTQRIACGFHNLFDGLAVNFILGTSQVRPSVIEQSRSHVYRWLISPDIGAQGLKPLFITGCCVSLTSIPSHPQSLIGYDRASWTNTALTVDMEKGHNGLPRSLLRRRKVPPPHRKTSEKLGGSREDFISSIKYAALLSHRIPFSISHFRC